ncbi:glycosyltransferase family A protein [Aestuariivirga sp.]|uniref:glycosyltransferase family A protein n=1 Tax=Aestuariivirga sp. TaxID=2650926 RepID=UPI003BABC024
MRKGLSVLIPSRLQELELPSDGKSAMGPPRIMLDRAISSIRRQTILGQFNVQILVGVDEGADVPRGLASEDVVQFVESEARSQASSLNSAAACMRGDFVAILEDDDEWSPEFLEYGMAALEHCDFVSSTQLEVSISGDVIRILDFPTPSGWLMRRKTWQSVGEFNEEYRWHLDNEWLGRLGDRDLARAHLVEATAPIDIEAIREVRPTLMRCLALGGPRVRLARHRQPYPLVRRLVHERSGMAQIRNNGAAQQESKDEYEKLIQQYGRLPW